MPERSAGSSASKPACLVLLPHSYTGRGPAESCVRILDAFPESGLDTTLFVLRARKAINPGLRLVEGAGPLLRRLPFRYMRKAAMAKLQHKFSRAIERASPGSIAWFWPDSPIELVRKAKAYGLVTVREMINSPVAHAKPILDAAYKAHGFAPAHGITDADVARENEELALYDYVFASNPEVEEALLALGIDRARILSSSFGWDRGRFPLDAAEPVPEKHATGIRVCFVGLMNVRKGVPELLEAWRLAGLDGELIVAGSIEECLVPLLERAKTEGQVRHLGHVSDVASLYRSCDVFVFPTHEEGGPQVTYEAAACGLPVVTTPMGAARLVEDGRTGLLVEAGNVESIVAALKTLAADPDLRRACGDSARLRANAFEYGAVGRQRVDLLHEVLDDLRMRLMPT